MLISFFFLKPDYPWDSWEEQESRDLFETSETNASSLLNQHGFLPKVGNGEKQYTHIEDLTFFFTIKPFFFYIFVEETEDQECTQKKIIF